MIFTSLSDVLNLARPFKAGIDRENISFCVATIECFFQSSLTRRTLALHVFPGVETPV